MHYKYMASISSPCEESFKWLITTQHAVVFTLWSLHIFSSCACSTSGPKVRVFSSLLMLNWLWRLFKDLLDFWCNLAPNVSSQSSVSDAFVRCAFHFFTFCTCLWSPSSVQVLSWWLPRSHPLLHCDYKLPGGEPDGWRVWRSAKGFLLPPS